MATKLTITVPDDLAKRLDPHREHMNISRVCAAALEAELNSLEAHLASLARYEEFKRMRAEAEAIRQQMMTQTGRGWQKLAQDMQRMLKDISHEIEQLEKQIPEGLRTAAATEPGLPEPEVVMEEAPESPEPEAVVDMAPESPEPEPVAAQPPPPPEPKHTVKKGAKAPEPELAVAQ